jgi:ribonuclease PH
MPEETGMKDRRSTTRSDGRAVHEMRPVKITPGYLTNTDGSVLIELGNTRVLCTVSVESKVPQFLKNSGKGWLTSEYSMLPGSTAVRTPRESTRGRVSGRTAEIQRMIGRSLRSVVNLNALGEKTFWVDCDVLQADGGTRTISITGATVALALAFRKLLEQDEISQMPLNDVVAATSVGKLNDRFLLDLNYEEDSAVEVDLNVVKTRGGKFIEIQGTAEMTPFSRKELDSMLKLAGSGIEQLHELQLEVLKGIFP